MSFPDEVVLKAMSNLARPMEVKKERKVLSLMIYQEDTEILKQKHQNKKLCHLK